VLVERRLLAPQRRVPAQERPRSEPIVFGCRFAGTRVPKRRRAAARAQHAGRLTVPQSADFSQRRGPAGADECSGIARLVTCLANPETRVRRGHGSRIPPRGGATDATRCGARTELRPEDSVRTAGAASAASPG